jgi:hypothetical protein
MWTRYGNHTPSVTFRAGGQWSGLTADVGPAKNLPRAYARHSCYRPPSDYHKKVIRCERCMRRLKTTEKGR